MKYAEAFKVLGYDLQARRTDWSAENENGVCISIWEVEINPRDGLPWIDTRLHGGDLSVWKLKLGNTKRIRHLTRVTQEFNGVVDVVIVYGRPSVSYKDADPWLPAKRQGATWRIIDFDPETGHFAAEVRRLEK